MSSAAVEMSPTSTLSRRGRRNGGRLVTSSLTSLTAAGTPLISLFEATSRQGHEILDLAHRAARAARRINDASLWKILSSLDPSSKSPMSRILKGFLELKWHHSRTFNLTLFIVSATTETQGHRQVYRVRPEVPGHHHKQLMQTLIVWF